MTLIEFLPILLISALIVIIGMPLLGVIVKYWATVFTPPTPAPAPNPSTGKLP